MHLQMVMQVSADTRQIVHHVYTVFPQMFRWADAGEHQKMRR